MLKGLQAHAKYSAPLIIREMQIKPAVSYHLAPVRMAYITGSEIMRLLKIRRKGKLCMFMGM